MPLPAAACSRVGPTPPDPSRATTTIDPRGTAESLSLWDWLKTYVDPAHKALTPEIAHFAQACGYTDAVSTRSGCSPLDDDGFMLRRVEVDGRASLTAFVGSLTS